MQANKAQFDSLNIRTVLTDQISCFQTLFQGIRLLPSFFDLLVSANKLTFLARPHSEIPDYHSGLGEFVELWLNRFETLLSDSRITISCDLTGGKDSRFVFALLQRARQRLGTCQARAVLNSSPASHWAADWRAATAIAKEYGLVLNEAASPRNRSMLTHREIYQNWYDLNTGIYYPLYFPQGPTDPFHIHFDGAGGENHRAFYTDSITNNVFQKYARPFLRYENLYSWADDLESTMQVLIARTSGVNPWILHFPRAVDAKEVTRVTTAAFVLRNANG